ncbi:Ldh family oxidoreductase [Streptosporangium canum]|uniref:Ldh family oxidoreductase n=1 Tax=Streptosporangium canum TaxID=324952 RepID=UPI0037B51BD4
MSTARQAPTMVRVDVQELTGYLIALYRYAGTSPAHARIIARSQVEADLRGVTTHGSRLAPGYVAKLRAGALNPRPRMTVLADSAAALALDADRAPGPVAACTAIDAAMRRARTAGVAVVTARNAGHAGALGVYTARAAQRGLIGLLAAQTSAASVALRGGTRPLLGNCALSIAVPGPNQREPVLLDMALGALSWGAVKQRRADHRLLPADGALDVHGAATRDPHRAAMLLSFGGLRGQALAIVVELLAGALTGSSPLPSDMEGRGLLCLAICPDHLALGDRLPAGVATLAHAVRGHTSSATTRMPGDRSWAQRATSLTDGIILDRADVQALITAGHPATPAPPSWSRTTAAART